MFLDVPWCSQMFLDDPRCSLWSSATSISDGIFTFRINQPLIVSKYKINIICRHDHQWPSISKNPSPRISRVWHNPRDSKHIQDRQCTEIYWDVRLYTTEHPTLGSSPEMFYDIAQTTILEILITWWFNPSMSSLSHHCISIFQSSRNFLSLSTFHFLLAISHSNALEGHFFEKDEVISTDSVDLP